MADNNTDGRNAADERTPLLRDEAEAEPSPPPPRPVSRRRQWISLAFAALLTAGVVTILVLYGVFRSRDMNTSVCTTPACLQAASVFLSSLSPKYKTLDPCTNFEELVCDGWRDQHIIRPESGQNDSFSAMSDRSQVILRSILEAQYPGPHVTVSLDQDNFNKAQGAYNACMAMDDIKKRGLSPIEKMLDDLSVTFGNGSDWSDAQLYLSHNGVRSIIGLGVGADDKFPDTQVISVEPRVSPGLPAVDYYQDGEVVADYQDAIGKVLGAFKLTKKNATERAAALVDFEKKIAAFTPPRSAFSDIKQMYNPMNFSDAVKLVPQLGLEKVLKALAPKNYTIEKVIAPVPEYFSSLKSLLSSTPKETVETYLIWQVITYKTDYVEAPELLPYKRFSRKLNGQDPDAVPERYRTCIRHVDSTLGWILSRFYIEKAFSAQAKALGDQIIADIKNVYIDRLQSLDWMDDSVKKLAVEKVKKILPKVGYPTASPNITDAEDLKKYYAGLNISSGYFENALASSKFKGDKGWAQLGKPTDRAEWGMTAPTVNAYFNPPLNEIVFPAGIMQFPFFGGDLPGYVNYAAFGAVSGHELSHAFDPTGSEYDADGVYRTWWTNHTRAEFNKRAECIIQEYSNFTIKAPNGTTLHVNGKQTVGENVADAGGLSAAWSAWQNRRKTHPDQSLQGLDFFTQEQLFYVSFGNIWCSKYKAASLMSRVLTDPHSPNMYRIEGTAMLNSRGFRQAFNCPVKEPVCEIW